MTDLPAASSLSRRALSFLRGHGHRLSSERAQRSASDWTRQGVDSALVQRALEYEQRWGDLYLPPSIGYNGGPRYLGPDIILGDWSTSGYMEAGPARFSVSYDFLVDASGVFGVAEVDFVPLYATVEGWIESLALEYAVRRTATEITRFTGPDVASLQLSDLAAFPGIPGLSDRWLMDDERVVFSCRGMGLVSNVPELEFALVYSGIRDRDASLDL